MISFQVTFGVGVYAGIYITQNYEVPRVDEPSKLWEKLSDTPHLYRTRVENFKYHEIFQNVSEDCQLLSTLVVTHKLASAFVAFVNCKQTWRPLHPQQAVANFSLLFLTFNAPYKKLFRQLCPLINNIAAHLGQLFLGSSALERCCPREM
ncbi:hypothetical protein E2C01_018274 [Portunus trituberculatus]|uniref:Uncharacterized protein n=1 Tax=Portunus trituberculatus TaxID=210409 RepID=A0A5B7DU33_PORTR|nr:hypothetical protein [Portunus trituberculatus]